MPSLLMNLKVLLPFRVFADVSGLTRIVVETHVGSYGLLPRRLDCVAALVPGILVYESESHGEVFVALDEGILVKTGLDVVVSVRQAHSGTDLGALRESVEREYNATDQHEENARSVMAKLESGFIRQFAAFAHE